MKMKNAIEMLFEIGQNGQRMNRLLQQYQIGNYLIKLCLSKWGASFYHQLTEN